MYGTGSLQLGNAWWDGGGQSAKHDAEFRERWRTTLDPAWRLRGRDTPIAWFTGTNDVFFWMPGVVRSYEMAAGAKHLSLLPNFNHAMTPTLDEQTFEWLDVHLKDKPAFDRVTPVELVTRENDLLAQWTFRGPRPAASAEMIVSPGDAGNWSSRYWMTLPVEMRTGPDGAGTCTVRLPTTDLPCYASGTVIDRQGFRYSTPLARVAPEQFAAGAARVPPDYDGCSQWGGFEESQIAYSRLHGHPIPSLAADAHDGKQAAKLNAGKTTLPPILFTAGVAHRLSFFAKAETPVQGIIELVGTFDGKPFAQKREFPITAQWSRQEMDFTPPVALAADLHVTLTVPAATAALVDSFTFRPIMTGK